MTLLAEYHDARRDEDVARLRRVISLRAMVATGIAFTRFTQLIEQVLGREIDLISYGGLKPKMDDDIRR